MKKQFSGFVAGILTSALVGTLGCTALAASGVVTFNRSPIQFNGEQISAAGEDYALDNGCMAPSSITYTDEKGGGTTYLPARRIAELMGVGIGWDAATGAVRVSGETAPTTIPDPDTTASVADYSDWTAEEEAAYQEFKGLWEIGRVAEDKSYVGLRCYKLVSTGADVSEEVHIGEAAVSTFLSTKEVELIEKCCIRLDSELYEQYKTPEIRYAFPVYGSWGWSDKLSADGWECGYKSFLDYSS